MIYLDYGSKAYIHRDRLLKYMQLSLQYQGDPSQNNAIGIEQFSFLGSCFDKISAAYGKTKGYVFFTDDSIASIVEKNHLYEFTGDLTLFPFDNLEFSGVLVKSVDPKTGNVAPLEIIKDMCSSRGLKMVIDASHDFIPVLHQVDMADYILVDSYFVSIPCGVCLIAKSDFQDELLLNESRIDVAAIGVFTDIVSSFSTKKWQPLISALDMMFSVSHGIKKVTTSPCGHILCFTSGEIDFYSLASCLGNKYGIIIGHNDNNLVVSVGVDTKYADITEFTRYIHNALQDEKAYRT